MLAALHVVESASWAALVAAICGVLTSILGVVIAHRQSQIKSVGQEVKVLVNGRLTAALTRIEQLEATIHESNKDLPADPGGPHG